ncbi:hypothetical protein WJX81_007962 [Elliptochloris bilobata]|uniref:SGNH hydrolase-type esterase domain-containing protein n=1 Tax=Elliptochloris bilobata TaxID=381761 RepID=A0AAW1RI87_9CHLO
MDKLLSGQPISAIMLGGSVEIGAELRAKDDAYFAHVSRWINETFPVKPGAGSHTFHNAARSATGSPFFASCLHDHVPDQNVDLVFLQFDVNDGQKAPYMNNGHRRSLEVIIRKMLQLPHRPAVVYLHWWSPTLNQGRRSFWNSTVQPETGLFAHYYGLPSVSLRDVWFHKWAVNQPGFRQRDIMCSVNHPNVLGHQYMADLVIALLQNYAAATTLFPPTEGDAAAVVAELPEPMLPSNWESATGACLHDESLHAAALPGMESTKGFAWVDDKTSYGAHRWGWASEHVGDFLELQVDTSIPESPAGADSWLSVAVLMSYQHMGAAQFECVRNCKCNTLQIDALWKLRMSIKEHWHVKVTASPECVVRLSNVAPERADGNRFKLEAFTVRPGDLYLGEGMYHFGSERYALVENGQSTSQARY